MTKEEFEARIKAEGLIGVYDGDIRKIYTDYHMVYNEHGKWINNIVDIYGCYEVPLILWKKPMMHYI